MSEVLLHLHIPKAGGTTMRNVLFEQYADAANDAGNDPYMSCGIYYYPADVLGPADPQMTEAIRRSLGRDDLRAVFGHFAFGIHAYVPRKSTYITMLREPADRLVSLYQLLVQLPDRYGFPRGTGFHEFVTKPRFPEVYNDQTRRIAGKDPGPGDTRRDVLELAQENLERDFRVAGTLEKFEETLLLLKQRLGWTKPIQYFPRRQSTMRPGLGSLPRQTMEAIREMSALDYELYEFADRLLERAIADAGPEFARELEAFRVAQLSLHNKLAWEREEAETKQRANAAAKKPTRGDAKSKTPA